ncbi:MAG TPA: hypothetical protein VNN80_33455, partial [Polyangiaceae bacterium]|nr:hypothetical protein [Polyangiaceae bacterium]
TVRQVQAARVPPLSQYVRDVPAPLERILNHALARDPKARYQTARDFGRDLNGILFQMGRPVSSFEIGALVGDVREEQRRQKGTRPKQQTLIGSLIQDAIMSFRSLTDEESKAAAPSPDEQSGVGALPLSLGTFEGSISAARVPAPEPSATGRSEGSYSARFQAGNLAALEDGADAPAPASAPRPPNRKPRPSRQPQPPAPPGYDPALLAATRLSGAPPPVQVGNVAQQVMLGAPGPTRLPVTYWVITATLVAVGAAVGAYLAGMFS